MESQLSSSKLVASHQPCLSCGSSDALAEYDDGHSYCFACSTLKDSSKEAKDTTNKELKEEQFLVSSLPSSKDSFSYQNIDHRGIFKSTFKFFGVRAKVDKDGKPLVLSFPYGVSASKEKLLDRKEFFAVGDMKDAQPLFGMDKFAAGSAKAITVTEGELDACTAFQLLGSKWPTVSVRSATTARRDCERARDYLNSFEKIYLCFDNDEPGQKALREVSQLFDVNKVYHVKLDKYKDPNEFLTNGEGETFVRLWWNSRPYIPKGIIATYEDIEGVLRTEGSEALASYPFQSLEEMAYGIRSKEIVLFTAQEKVGKTEVIRAIEYHLLKTTDHNIGIIHLEEEEKRSVLGLVGYELGIPAHLPDSSLSIDDQLAAFKALTRRDGRVFFYPHFGSDDPNTILDIIRYLVGTLHCRFIFLDHITMLVTGFEGDDERKKLDYLSTRLAMLTRELDFTLFLISHVNDDGKTRGSRNISKIADMIIYLDRDLEEGSNHTKLLVKGNRFSGLTGPGGILEFDPKTFKLKELPKPEEIDFNPEI